MQQKAVSFSDYKNDTTGGNVGIQPVQLVKTP